MAIYINVDNDTTTDISNYKPKITTVDGTPVNRGTQQGGGGGTATVTSGFLPGNPPIRPSVDITGSIIQNFSTAQGGNAIDRNSTGNGDRSRTLKSIYLPIPLNISANAKAEYAGFEFGEEARKIGYSALDQGLNLAASLAAASKGPSAGAAATQGIAMAKAISNYALSGSSAKLGRILNPHKQLLFKGVELRNFDFQYKLVARNVEETDTIDYIIRLLRYHMLPDLGSGIPFIGAVGLSGAGMALKYPSEFDMAFYMYDGNSQPKLNPYLPAISTCVLTKMDVTYGEKEIVSHADGSPVELTLSLSFQETQVMTKSVVKAFDSYINTGNLKISDDVYTPIPGDPNTTTSKTFNPTIP
jgi:hypothetical protein